MTDSISQTPTASRYSKPSYPHITIPGPRLNIKTVLSTYGDFHVKDKTAVGTWELPYLVRPSFLLRRPPGRSITLEEYPLNCKFKSTRLSDRNYRITPWSVFIVFHGYILYPAIHLSGWLQIQLSAKWWGWRGNSSLIACIILVRVSHRLRNGKGAIYLLLRKIFCNADYVWAEYALERGLCGFWPVVAKAHFITSACPNIFHIYSIESKTPVTYIDAHEWICRVCIWFYELLDQTKLYSLIQLHSARTKCCEHKQWYGPEIVPAMHCYAYLGR